MTGIAIGAAGFDTAARRGGAAAAAEPALVKNAREYGGVAEHGNSQDFIGACDGTRLHFLHHFDNERLEFTVDQVL